MCNVYRLKRKQQAQGFEADVDTAIGALPTRLVRRSGVGVTLRFDGGKLSAGTMRWGFQRSFSNAINNARSDNLASPVWAEAYASRRCLVPMSVFYEWQHLPGGRKQAHEFRREDGDWMWIAGLWETSDTCGPCFATITTAPSALVSPIHDRMLAITSLEDGLAFLGGSTPQFHPYSGTLTASACDSPLKRQQGPSGPEQGDLF